jgi:F-type H+-transporting ATPase subunit delta
MAALGGSVARRYARALFQLGVDRGTFETLGLELEALAAVYASSAELRQSLENPVFRANQRRALLEKLLPRVAPSRAVQSFALLLLERKRISALPLIARAYQEMVDAQLGRVRATVVSARPLDVMAEAEIQRALERRTGKKVIVRTEVDPDLIGGVVARVGDLVLDGSLRTRLATLGSRILLN